jgi:hypothetical protein
MLLLAADILTGLTLFAPMLARRSWHHAPIPVVGASLVTGCCRSGRLAPWCSMGI